MSVKTCSSCPESDPTKFSKNRSNAHGLAYECRKCANARYAATCDLIQARRKEKATALRIEAHKIKIEHLKAIIKCAEREGSGGCCPWCRSWFMEDRPDHADNCAAFNPDGSVK